MDSSTILDSFKSTLKVYKLLSLNLFEKNISHNMGLYMGIDAYIRTKADQLQ